MAKGYDVNYAWGIGVHRHDMGGAMLPETTPFARPIHAKGVCRGSGEAAKADYAGT